MVPHHEFWVGLPALCMVPHPSAFSFSTHTRILYRDEPIGQRVILRVDHFGHLFQRNETRSQRLIAVSVLLWPSWPLSGHLGPFGRFWPLSSQFSHFMPTQVRCGQFGPFRYILGGN